MSKKKQPNDVTWRSVFSRSRSQHGRWYVRDEYQLQVGAICEEAAYRSSSQSAGTMTSSAGDKADLACLDGYLTEIWGVFFREPGWTNGCWLDGTRLFRYVLYCLEIPQPGRLWDESCIPTLEELRQAVSRSRSAEHNPALAGPMGHAYQKDRRHSVTPESSDRTSVGDLWSEVPEPILRDMEWIEGRHGAAEQRLPSPYQFPTPKIFQTLPLLDEARPRGSKAMLDAHGAKARLAAARPGAWLISPLTGQKWARWPTGQVGWVRPDVELPAELRVASRNDLH